MVDEGLITVHPTWKLSNASSKKKALALRHPGEHDEKERRQFANHGGRPSRTRSFACSSDNNAVDGAARLFRLAPLAEECSRDVI